jgi:hypothetical protein
MKLNEVKNQTIETIKEQLKTRSAVSVIRTLGSIRDEQRTKDPDFELIINAPLIEEISSEIVSDDNYERTARGDDYYISIKKDFRTWKDRHPVIHDIILAIITAALSLLVGYILWRVDNESKKQDKQEIMNQLNKANNRIDSLVRLPIFHYKIVDTAKHKQYSTEQ